MGKFIKLEPPNTTRKQSQVWWPVTRCLIEIQIMVWKIFEFGQVVNVTYIYICITTYIYIECVYIYMYVCYMLRKPGSVNITEHCRLPKRSVLHFRAWSLNIS